MALAASGACEGAISASLILGAIGLLFARLRPGFLGSSLGVAAGFAGGATFFVATFATGLGEAFGAIAVLTGVLLAVGLAPFAGFAGFADTAGLVAALAATFVTVFAVGFVFGAVFPAAFAGAFVVALVGAFAVAFTVAFAVALIGDFAGAFALTFGDTFVGALTVGFGEIGFLASAVFVD